MKSKSIEKIKKYCAILGAHFITAPVSFIWVYGNLSEYMDSYFRFACSPGCMDISSEWILSAIIAMGCPGTLISKFLANKMGLKCAGVASFIVLNVALFGSAWTVKISIGWTTLLLGFVLGFVQGITNVVAFTYVRAWAPSKATLLMATTSGASTLLSMIQNQVITAVVNPNNLKPDVEQDSRMFFSQPEVLDRVPTVLIVYAAMTLCFQGFGYLLLLPPPQASASESASKESGVNLEPDKGRQITLAREKFTEKSSLKTLLDPNTQGNGKSPSNPTYGYNQAFSSPENINNDGQVEILRTEKFQVEENENGKEALFPPRTENSSSRENGHNLKYKTHDSKRLSKVTSLCNRECEQKVTNSPEKVPMEDTKTKNSALTEDKQISLQPSEILKTSLFYAISMFGIATLYALILKANYYKQFALLYIHDDRYLTLVGTLIPLVATISRFAAGTALNEKFVSIKDVLLACLAVNGFLCAFWYFVPRVSALLYLFLILGLATVQSLYYVTLPIAAMELFGPAHFSTNYGLLLTTLTIVGVLGPVVMSPIMHSLGWFWLFASASFLCLVAMFFVICTEFRPPRPSVE